MQVVIVGGGPVGLISAIMLGKNGIDCTIIDPNVPKDNDGRVLAMADASIKLLEEYRSWSCDLATVITKVRIAHDGFGVSDIDAKLLKLKHLGATIKYADLCAILHKQVAKVTSCKIITGKVASVINNNNQALITYDDGIIEKYDLAIVAEGGNITIEDIEAEVFDYEQIAIIAKLKIESLHDNIAYEYFLDNGTMVFLPYNDGYVLVYSVLSENAKEYLQDPIKLSELLNRQFYSRFGMITIDQDLVSFPLKLRYTNTNVCGNIAVIGNAAQTLHPFSAQGLNLGLRDASTLIDLLVGMDKKQALAKFANLRQKDAKKIIGFTHTLTRVLDLEIPLKSLPRGMGILSLAGFPLLQNTIAKSLIYGC